MKKVLWVVVILWVVNAKSASLTETFDSTARKGSGSLVWNIGLGQLHSPMTVSNWQPPAGAVDSWSVDFGDGRHGIFNSTTITSFDGDASTPTVIDLDTNELQVTDFELPTGYTLRPRGSGALIIRSLKDVELIGTAIIDCSGGNGTDTQTPATSSAAGGTGRCGGGNGGAGGRHTGTAFVAAERGYPQSGGTNPIGGAGGANGTYGGGGGGSLYNQANPGNGYDPAGALVNGTQGTNLDNTTFTQMIGSAGGGGGGAYVVSGPTDSTGAGGGAGGGIVRIYARRDFISAGVIRANGGNGGNIIDPGTGFMGGGAGGGGGGGTVIIYAGRDYTNNGNIYVAPGTGGGRTAGNIGRGGSGGPARAWYTDNDGTLAGTGSEDTNCILAQCGTMVFDTGAIEGISTSIDLQNTRPQLDSVSANATLGAGGSSVLYYVASSSDNFASDDSGWVATTSLSSLAKKRYIKFKVRLNNQDATNGSSVEDLTINYSQYSQEEYNFGVACGRIEGASGPSVAKFFFELLFMLMPLFVVKALAHLSRSVAIMNKLTYK